MLAYHLDSFFNYLHFQKGYSSHTLAAYRRDLSFFSQDVALDALSSLIVSFHTWLSEQHYSLNSLRRKKYALKSFLKFLCQQGLVDAATLADFVLPKAARRLPRCLDEQSIQALFTSLDRSSRFYLRDFVILELLYGAGLRVSELCQLRLSAISFDKATLRVLGKGGAWRCIPIADCALEAILAYLPLRLTIVDQQNTDYLLLSCRAKPLTRQFIFMFVRKLVAKAGLEGVYSPHSFRHSYASHLLEGGAGLSDVQALLGHADVSSTQVYTHLNTGFIKSVYKKCHPRT
ncbi:MAG: tyrosine-type recombinase/integrase [bacterium]